MKYNTKLIDDYLAKNRISKTRLCRKVGIDFATLKRVYENKFVLQLKLITLARGIHCTYRELCGFSVPPVSKFISVEEIFKPYKTRFRVEILLMFLKAKNMKICEFCNLCNFEFDDYVKICSNDTSVQLFHVLSVTHELGVELEDFIVVE